MLIFKLESIILVDKAIQKKKGIIFMGLGSSVGLSFLFSTTQRAVDPESVRKERKNSESENGSGRGKILPKFEDGNQPPKPGKRGFNA